MNSAEDRRLVSALAKLLREELREARFSVARLVRTEAELLSGDVGGAMSTTFERTAETELDADGVKALHDAGSWKRELFQYELWTETLPGGTESARRRTEFEHVLNDLGVLSDGHVAHPLGPLIIGPTLPRIRQDSPVGYIGIAKTADFWGYLVLDACLGTPRRTASKVVRWGRGAMLPFETHVLLGQVRADASFVLGNGPRH